MFKVNFTEKEIRLLTDAAYVLDAIAEFGADTDNEPLSDAANDTYREIVAVLQETSYTARATFNASKHFTSILKDALYLLDHYAFFVDDGANDSDFYEYTIAPAQSDLRDFIWYLSGVDFDQSYLSRHFVERSERLQKLIDASEIQLEICRVLYHDRVENGKDPEALEYEMALILSTIREYTDKLHDLQQAAFNDFNPDGLYENAFAIRVRAAE